MEEFKLIVAGGRDFNDFKRLEHYLLTLCTSAQTINGLFNKNVSIVSGMAKGADALAVAFAAKHGVMLYEVPADWNKYGKRAGFIRNSDMASMADGLVAFWDGESRGTKHMIDTMREKNKPVWVIRY